MRGKVSETVSRQEGPIGPYPAIEQPRASGPANVLVGPAARSRAPGPGAWLFRDYSRFSHAKKALFMVQPSLDLNAIGVPLCAVATCL